MKSSLIFLLFLVLVFILAFKSSLSANTLTISLNSTKVWWQDGILASGRLVNETNDPIAGMTVTVKISGATQCSDATNSTGHWECSFTAPNEIGVYTITADTGTETASTTLTVAPYYGKTPVGATTRVVYELPMLIQDLNGEIKIIFAKVMIWKG
jgi:hypothetical protein